MSPVSKVLACLLTLAVVWLDTSQASAVVIDFEDAFGSVGDTGNISQTAPQVIAGVTFDNYDTSSSFHAALHNSGKHFQSATYGFAGGTDPFPASFGDYLEFASHPATDVFSIGFAFPVTSIEIDVATCCSAQGAPTADFEVRVDGNLVDTITVVPDGGYQHLAYNSLPGITSLTFTPTTTQDTFLDIDNLVALPEPTSFALAVFALLGLVGYRRRPRCTT